jgi:hypothetical protein
MNLVKHMSATRGLDCSGEEPMRTSLNSMTKGFIKSESLTARGGNKKGSR